MRRDLSLVPVGMVQIPQRLRPQPSRQPGLRIIPAIGQTPVDFRGLEELVDRSCAMVPAAAGLTGNQDAELPLLDVDQFHVLDLEQVF